MGYIRTILQAQRLFETKSTLNVTFAAIQTEEEEDAIDNSDHRRELFHLLIKSIIKDSKCFLGKAIVGQCENHVTSKDAFIFFFITGT